MKTIALLGNPNSGKSTLVNALTGANERVGNWSGVTMEKTEGVALLQAKAKRRSSSSTFQDATL